MRPRVAMTPAEATTAAMVLKATYPAVPCSIEATPSLTEETSDNRRMGPGRLTAVFSSSVTPVARLPLEDAGQVTEHRGESGACSVQMKALQWKWTRLERSRPSDMKAKVFTSNLWK